MNCIADYRELDSRSAMLNAKRPLMEKPTRLTHHTHHVPLAR